MSTFESGTVTISPLGFGGFFTAGSATVPTFCVGPNSDNCATSGLSGSISIADTVADTSQITFSFSGSTLATSGFFDIFLAFNDPIAGAGYDSGALNIGTFALTSSTPGSLIFTGTPNGNFDATGGASVVFDVTTIDVFAPEPASVFLCGLGLTGLMLAAIRRRHATALQQQ